MHSRCIAGHSFPVRFPVALASAAASCRPRGAGGCIIRLRLRPGCRRPGAVEIPAGARRRNPDRQRLSLIAAMLCTLIAVFSVAGVLVAGFAPRNDGHAGVGRLAASNCRTHRGAGVCRSVNAGATVPTHVPVPFTAVSALCAETGLTPGRVFIAVVFFWSWIDGVLFSFLLRTADQSFAQLDALIEEDVPPTLRPDQSGVQIPW